MMLRILSLLLLTRTVPMTILGQGIEVSKSASVGKSFPLTKVDAFGYVGGGIQLFSQLPESCFEEKRERRRKSNNYDFNDNAELVDKIAMSVGLDSGQEIKGSPTANAKYMSASQSGKSGHLREELFFGRTRVLLEDCILEKYLEPSILEDLKSVPYPVNNPHIPDSWHRYEVFLNKWGTHLLRETKFGVKVMLHSTKTVADSKEGFESGWFASAKNWLTVDSKDFRNQVENKDDVQVYGGSDESLVRLQQSKGVMDEELTKELTKEALTHEAPIKNVWNSVPLLLNTMLEFGEDEGLKLRSIALVNFYKGFHLFGCSKYVIDGQNVTVFVNEGDELNPIFKCMQARPGCQTGEDCHTSPFPYISPCYCAGKGCVGLVKDGAKTKSSRQFANRRTHEGSYSDTTNERCYWIWGWGSCQCDLRELEEVWPLGSSVYLPSEGDDM